MKQAPCLHESMLRETYGEQREARNAEHFEPAYACIDSMKKSSLSALFFDIFPASCAYR